MHNVTGNWPKVVVLCAILATGCNSATDGIIHSNVPGPPAPPAEPREFTASGDWWVPGADPDISYRFSSMDDGEIMGDFTGTETVWSYYSGGTSEVRGHWESSTVTFTVKGQTTYTGSLTRDNPTAVTFTSTSGYRTLER